MISQINKIVFATILVANTFYAQQNLNIKMWAVSLEQGTANPLYVVNPQPLKTNAEWKNQIYIQPETSFQTMEGIGGAFNEIGGQALLSLPKEQQLEVMQNLFAGNKAGFTFCRTSIGASDFGLDAYSYSMVPNDYQMEQISIERDEKYVLPYIKTALQYNPQLTIFASPWSPPAWMKISGEMEGLKGKTNSLLDDNKIYQAYAKYFVKYIQEYKKNGVFVDRICIQNENDADTKYPSCVFPAKEMVSFANTYLIPAFEKSKVKTKIYAGTFRAADQLDLLDFVQEKNTKKIAGVGIQYTASNLIADALKLQPNLKIFHTEGNCFNGANSADEAKTRLEEVANYINSGSTTFTYWNMILNETTKSGWNWPQNSLININLTTAEVRYNPDYNAMYIISQFIKPGDVRIASFSKGKHPMITVKSPDGTIKVLIQNTNAEDKTFKIDIKNTVKMVTIPAQTITAMSIQPN